MHASLLNNWLTGNERLIVNIVVCHCTTINALTSILIELEEYAIISNIGISSRSAWARSQRNARQPDGEFIHWRGSLVADVEINLFEIVKDVGITCKGCKAVLVNSYTKFGAGYKTKDVLET